MLKKKSILINLYIQCNFKNTIVSLINAETGFKYKQWSTQSLKKNDFRKNNPYNLQLISNRIRKFLFLKKIRFINIYIKGQGLGRYHILRHLMSKKFYIYNIIDKTTLPFNGCRASKKKRR